jgi:hypothetical protein
MDDLRLKWAKAYAPGLLAEGLERERQSKAPSFAPLEKL